MRVALLSYGAEGLGLQYLATAIKRRGHSVRLFYDPCLFSDRLLLDIPKLANAFSIQRHIVTAILRYEPDLVGISLLTDTFQWGLGYARALKFAQPQIPIVVGGTHATLLPERVAQEACIDFIVRGDGEIPLANLVESLAKRDGRTNIPSIWFRTDDGVVKNAIASPVTNLMTLGIPDRSVYEPFVNTRRYALAVSSRGCVYTCTYCHQNALRKLHGRSDGAYLRRLAPEQFVSQLKESHRDYGYRMLLIYDEIFTYDFSWLKEFAERYKRDVAVPFFCLGHPNFLDERTIRALKSAGCVSLQFGIQSLNPGTRSVFLRRNETGETTKAAIDLLERYRIPYQPDFMFGLPGDTEEDYLATAKYFSNKRSLSKLNTNILSLQPKTDMVGLAIESGMIGEEDKQKIDNGEEPSSTGVGSVRDEATQTMHKNFTLLYKIATKLPAFVTAFLIRSGQYKKLFRINPVFAHGIRLVGVDTRDRLYVLHYFRYIPRNLLSKFRHLFASSPT